MEIVALLTLCFIIIYKDISYILLVDKKLSNLNNVVLEMHKDLINFNKELNLFYKNESIKNTANKNSIVKDTADQNLIKGSQITEIPLEKLAEIIKEENKLCSTEVTVQAGEDISGVNMEFDKEKLMNLKEIE